MQIVVSEGGGGVGGFKFSTNLGTNWSPLNMSMQFINYLYKVPSFYIVYAAGQDISAFTSQFFSSSDLGETWKSIPFDPQLCTTFDAVCPRVVQLTSSDDGTVVYAASSNGLYKSISSGF
jgi:hypothetical protein